MNYNYSNEFILNMMERAIELSKRGRGNVSPNPLVGCVIVKDSKIIGEGYHEIYGGNHAEKNAIDNCIEDPLGSTAFVTLEPCCIHSKTPPCTQLLIDNGIDEVFIASKDPNPDINGKGIEQLKNSGINVYQGFLDKDVSKLNKGFFKWVKEGLPFVAVKIAQNQDGYMGVNNETQTWITNEESRKNSHYLRSKMDSILIGTQTARIDNPKLTVRSVKGKNPKRIIVDMNRTLPQDINVFSDNEAETIVLCSENLFDRNKTSNCKYIPVKEVGGKMDVKDVLKKIANEGITSVLIESGPKLIESFDQHKLIDEVYIYSSYVDIPHSSLLNPLKLENEWLLKSNKMLGTNELQVFKRKELCLQE
tara:strand:- start:23 stop:1111 length:1089 start_codon:yes stop_codon:yes gene_type:complete